VIREALQLLDQRDQKECREQIEEGWLAARRGDFVDGDEVFDRIDAELAAADIAKNDRSGRG
jgi:Arc/MetJ-type ribon-helix-helix transcriptional regulator